MGRLRVLLVDPALGSAAAGSAIGMVAAGGVAGLALALLLGGARAGAVWLAALLLGALLGAALLALAIGDRRHLQRLRRGQRRFYGALGALGVGVVAAGAALSARPLAITAIVAVVAAVAVPLAGHLARRWAQDAAWRLVRGRRTAWLAQIRASRLTRRMIGYAAYRQLRRDGFLPVRSTIYPDRIYRVPLRTTPSGARILVLDRDRPVGGLCLRPREPLPDPEEALTHILAIRTDERAWLNRANFFPQDRELTPQALGLAPGRPGNYDR